MMGRPEGEIASPWPVLESGALHGLPGDVVRAILPSTEADLVTLLVHLISEFSAIIGRGPHIKLDGDYSPLSFWPVMVGDSSKSRKGSGSKRIRRLFRAADPIWTRGRHSGQLSSGEGLIYAVRDPELLDKTGEDGEPVVKDPGILDKRLYVVQSEFGSMLSVMAREGNSLSGYLRDAWDGETLKPMTKGNRVAATHPHIVICGHVTARELRKNLNEAEMSNGFANRFCWFLVRRSKCLPFADDPDQAVLAELAARLRSAIVAAEHVDEIGMTDAAREWWVEEYPSLSAGTPGLAGSLLDRAEAQVRRIAALYCLLDEQNAVTHDHLYGALCLWKYAETSVKLIFGELVGDRIADEIIEALTKTPEGLTDTQISGIFHRHQSAERLAAAKVYLADLGLIEPTYSRTGGRAAVTWVATRRAAAAAELPGKEGTRL